MSGTPKYHSTDTKCFQRIDHRDVAVVELFFLSTRVSRVLENYAHPEGFGKALCDNSVLRIHWRRGVLETDRKQDGRNVWRSSFPDMRQTASPRNWDSRNAEDVDISWELVRHSIQQLVLEFSPLHRHQTQAMGPPRTAGVPPAAE
ncbi:unnamed protein product [Echinostoma caproni]|uniref:DUF4268 domain-containing protein n=1 Tax=Echinostoma caproni TaxID=27848 RepID=A0A183AG82_9TREM|nr:unnamed protein product [Echinostoma caproni]